MQRRQILKASLAGSAGALLPAMAQAALPGAAYLAKMAAFDEPHPTDIRVQGRDAQLLLQVLGRLDRVKRTVGHGNFAVLGFDPMLRYARNYPAIGRFSAAELEFMERVFFREASDYGFMGPKVTRKLTSTPNLRNLVRVRRASGNLLYRGEPLQAFTNLQKRVGPDLVLTSGIRGVVKQFHLFLRKAASAGGDLSLASRSLAPPGYSFHGIGDFDVGQRGWGKRNFSSDFVKSPVHARLEALGVLQIRYPRNNLLGVRYEPWHIRIASVS